MAKMAKTPTRKRGQIWVPPNVLGEASAAPLVDKGYVNITSQGTRAVFVWHVTGLGGPVELRLGSATQVTGIPRYGDWSRPLGLFVTNVQADPVPGSPSQAHVTVEYGIQADGGGWFNNEPSETEPAQIEIVSTVQSATTNMHLAGPKKGQQILVSHIVKDEEAGTSTLVEQGGEIAFEDEMDMVIFRRRENFSPGVAVPNGGRGSSRMYRRHTNATVFMGDVAGTWFCTKMDGYSDDGGVTWNNTYEFQRREGTTLIAYTDAEAPVRWELPVPGWDTLAVYRDPETKEPIKVTNPGEVEVVQNYEHAEFHDLRLYVP
jgi:hypothetical protein